MVTRSPPCLCRQGVFVLDGGVLIASMAGSIPVTGVGTDSVPWHRVLPAPVLLGT